MSLAPGSRLGPYEIVEVLGAGGMGEVYRARDPRLGREVAIKVLAVRRSGDADALRRLGQEARTLAALNHPNLLSVYDIGATAEGQPYVVSELLEGQSLRQRLAGGAMPAGKAVPYAIQIAHGLAAAHEKGFVHRDLKPDNLFLTSDGRVKILDFGLAKLAGETAGGEETMSAPGTAPGTVMGTVGYMAPEQVRGQGADARSDIFSFGAVVYEMLAGRRAFAAESAVETMSAILKEEPPPLGPGSGGKGEIAPGLERIVRHCLEKEPRQRFQSAGDIAFHLEDVTQASSGGLRALPAPRRHLAAWIGAAGLGVAALAAGFWGLGRASARASPPQLHQLTFHRGLITGARFLPGQQSFVVSMRSGGSAPDAMYTGRLDGEGVQPLGPDGQEVAGVSSRNVALLLAQGPLYEFGGVGELSRMPLNGDAPRPVRNNVAAAEWSPDGSTMAIVVRDPRDNLERLEYPPGHVLATEPGWMDGVRVSPDGRRVAFLLHSVSVDDRGRVAVVGAAGKTTILTPLYTSVAGLAWAPGGKAIWYTAAQGGDLRSLYAVTPGGRIRRLLSGPTTLELEDVATDGRALVISSDSRYEADVAGAGQAAPRNLSILSETGVAALSNDGRLALLSESITPVYTSYLRDTNGGSPTLLGDGNAEAISPDGRWALLEEPDSGRLVLEPTGAGAARTLETSGIFWDAVNSRTTFAADNFLPDSRSIVAIGHAPGRPSRTYLVGLDGQASPITPEGAIGDWPTPDGRFVLAQSADQAWALYPIRGGAARPVSTLKPDDAPIRFGADDDELLAARTSPDGTAMQFLRLHLASGRRNMLADVHPADVGLLSFASAAISRDGTTYAYAVATEAGKLYLVTGLH